MLLQGGTQSSVHASRDGQNKRMERFSSENDMTQFVSLKAL